LRRFLSETFYQNVSDFCVVEIGPVSRQKFYDFEISGFGRRDVKRSRLTRAVGLVNLNP
jgi:hypothetical protein